MADKLGKKTGGRTKGTPNKKTVSLLGEMEQILTEDGQPVSVIKLFFQSLMDMPSFQRVDALLKFMEFLYPKRKHMEHDLAESDFKAALVKRIILLNSSND
jgi:hypothetical protein